MVHRSLIELIYFVSKGQPFPFPWIIWVQKLTGGSRGDYLNLLQQRCKRWQELCATCLDPALLCIGNKYNSPNRLCRSDELLSSGCQFFKQAQLLRACCWLLE